MDLTELSEDKRWQSLQNKEWKCSSCDEIHYGIMDFGCDWPDYWEGDFTVQPNSELFDKANVLTQDFCVIDNESFFVRCVLQMPILGVKNQSFAYGVWSSISPKNFQKYADVFDDDKQSHEGPWFGWFSNRLSGYQDTTRLKCQNHPQNNRQRPVLELDDIDHQLAREFHDGITIDRVLEIHKIYGHDLGVAE